MFETDSRFNSSLRLFVVFFVVAAGWLGSHAVCGLEARAQGPAQPEAMQFEPVDATDMVNLATGDLAYTIPILKVPGPEGSFPPALSYHSGIGPNQEATWVGLGWTLNPGAINRTLTGYPDDYNGDVIETNYQVDARGSWGLSIGAGWGPVGVNMSYDHYSGMVGVNGTVSYSKTFTGEDGFGIGGRVSFGTSGISGGLGLNYSHIGNEGSTRFSSSLGLNAGSQGVSGRFNVSAGTVDDENGYQETAGFSPEFDRKRKCRVQRKHSERRLQLKSGGSWRRRPGHKHVWVYDTIPWRLLDHPRLLRVGMVSRRNYLRS